LRNRMSEKGGKGEKKKKKKKKRENGYVGID
jgi:hypothetical protein